MECLINILWASMVHLTVGAAMSGLTNVLWEPMADQTFSCGRQWLTSRMFPLLLWAQMADLTYISPSPVGADV